MVRRVSMIVRGGAGQTAPNPSQAFLTRECHNRSVLTLVCGQTN